jgi:hypothetical protein
MNKRIFKVGDKVKIIGLPPIRLAPGAKDKLGTKKMFKRMLGRVYTLRGFDKYGHVELRPNRKNYVWIEQEFLKLHARRVKKAK